MVDRTLSAMLRTLRGRVTTLERRLARTPTRPDVGQLADAGDVKMTARATAPDGWMLCDGASLLRASYPALFSAIGTTYGSVDGTHFNLPDLRGRVAVGRDAAQVEFDVLGEKAGAKTHTLSATEMPSHTHKTGISTTLAFGTAGGGYSAVVGFAQSNADTSSAGGGGAHNNLQPYIVLNYLIKV